MTVFESPLEPSLTASAANDSAEDSSFESFFSVSALFHAYTWESIFKYKKAAIQILYLIVCQLYISKVCHLCHFGSEILHMVGLSQNSMFSYRKLSIQCLKIHSHYCLLPNLWSHFVYGVSVAVRFIVIIII